MNKINDTKINFNKKSLNFSVGSKAFIAGEYLALSGGPAVIAVTSPQFKLNVGENPNSSSVKFVEVKGIHPLSPAGLFVNYYNDFFKQFNLEFIDPYNGAGGFGASTAQFALVSGFYNSREAIENNAQPIFDYQIILKCYRELAWDKTGVPPSGSDLLAQFMGGLCIVDASLGRVEKLPWNFSNLNIGFIRTGNKVATHDHLKQLGSFDNSGLSKSVISFIEGIRNQVENQTIESFKAVGLELRRLGFQTEKTTSLINELQLSEYVLGAKGCGAMGADVVAVLYDIQNHLPLIQFLSSKGLNFQSTLSDLQSGFQMQWQDNYQNELQEIV